MGRALILGGGFTGSRTAGLLRARGWEVVCTNRSGIGGLRVDVGDPRTLDQVHDAIDRDTVVLHSIPVPGVMDALLRKPPARVVYLSTTGVYGAAPLVDENTPVGPRTERELLRVAEENSVLSGPWTSMVLRPAAIYGPGRGIHSAMRAGTYKLMGSGENFVSRIHVEDLARHAEAAIVSAATGAYPVADEQPCTSREIAEYCAKLLNLPMPPEVPAELLGETRRADRRVDGSAIRRLLGLTLQYPSYREVIPACLAAEEARAFSTS
jgi:nucleoside-diphosphate-sugar epimerase